VQFIPPKPSGESPPGSERDGIPVDGTEFRTFDALEAIRGGDPDAMDRIVNEYAPGLERYLRAKLGRRSRREDDTQGAAQEVWLRACRNLSHFEYRGKGSFWRYLKTIAKNLILKKRGRSEPLDVDEVADLSESASSPVRFAIAEEELARFEAAIQQLAERERAALLLRLQDETYAAIATKCGYSSLDAARVAVSRAKERIRHVLGAPPE
jgi:RNA polymerase sigma-70 factor (ECF subfamily)